MGRRHPNPGLVKLHQSYTIEEIARLLRTHKNTVRNWIRNHGLRTIDDRKRPLLVLGAELRRFLIARRNDAKRKCPPNHFYCFRCRAPKVPDGKMADYIPFSMTTGNLAGLCPDCGGWMYRCANRANLRTAHPELDVMFPQAKKHLEDGSPLGVNCDLKDGEEGDGHTQRGK